MQNRIHALGRFVGAPSLERIRTLLTALGNPQGKLKFIHIVGTNGKGSTAHMVASVLQQAGYRVGLFTSPFLVEFGERIRCNGENIDQQTLHRLGEQVFSAVADCQLQVGEFEFVMALGMLHFVEQQCDIIVLETGLGGQFDATNVIDTPELLLFTPISLDHTAVLGNTVAEIAHTKAQTVKQGGIVIDSAGQDPQASAQIVDMCTQKQATYLQAVAPKAVQTSLTATTFTVGIWTYQLGMLGAHQADNAALAISACDVLACKGWHITPEQVQQGLRVARHAGRLDCVSILPYTLLDGAHNQAGVGALCQFIRAHMDKPAIVLGMVSDKAVDACLQQLAPCASVLYLTSFASDRAISAERLCQMAEKYHTNCVCVSDCRQALHLAQTHHPQVVVAGSLYLVGELMGEQA